MNGKPVKIGGRWVCVENINMPGEPVQKPIKYDCKKCRDLNSNPLPPKPPPPKEIKINIIFIDGFSGGLLKDEMGQVKTEVINNLPKDYQEYARLNLLYFKWNEYDEIKRSILYRSRHSSPNNYLLVMGYSYGADTAFEIAWNEIAPGQSWFAPLIDDLWLLDPVGKGTPNKTFRGRFSHIVNDLIGGYHFKGDRRERLRIKMARRYRHRKTPTIGIYGWNGSDTTAYAGRWWVYHNYYLNPMKEAGYYGDDTTGTVSKNYDYRDIFCKKPNTTDMSELYHHEDLYNIMKDYGFFELAAKKCLEFYKRNKRK